MVLYVPELSFSREMIYSLAHNDTSQMAPLKNQNNEQTNKVQKEKLLTGSLSIHKYEVNKTFCSRLNIRFMKTHILLTPNKISSITS
jgi:hypothetical protein